MALKQHKSLKHISPISRAHLSIFILIFAAIGGIAIWRSLAAPNPNLPGDLNNDNTVNITDLSILLSNYGTSNTTADINGDGTVNVLDMSILLSHYGQSITASKPSIPTGLTATPGDTKVTLNWTANPSSDSVDTYQVYWTTDSTWATDQQNLNVTGTTYVVTGLTNGTTYYFRISAHNSAGYGNWTAPISAVPNGTISGGGGTGTGSILSFQSFPGGIDDSEVKSWPISGHVAAHATGGPNNQPYGRYTADATTTNGDGDIRVHDWDSGSNFPMLQAGAVSWRHIAIRIPSGFTNSDQSLFAGDEVHQSSQYGTTGPAPVNLSEDGIGQNWYFVARGSTGRGLASESTTNPFHQTVFGRTSNNNGTLVPFQGGARTVVADRWTYWLVGEKWDYNGSGWVEIWYRDSTTGAWVNVVPRYSNIYTSYNNQNFPMSSLYAPVSAGSGTRGIDYANGFYSDDYATALAKANQLDGF